MNILDSDTIKATLEKIAIEELQITPEKLSGDLSGQLDSIQRLSLVVAIEDHYEICFDTEDDQAILSLEDVVQLIQLKLQHQ